MKKLLLLFTVLQTLSCGADEPSIELRSCFMEFSSYQVIEDEVIYNLSTEGQCVDAVFKHGSSDHSYTMDFSHNGPSLLSLLSLNINSNLTISFHPKAVVFGKDSFELEVPSESDYPTWQKPTFIKELVGFWALPIYNIDPNMAGTTISFQNTTTDLPKTIKVDLLQEIPLDN